MPKVLSGSLKIFYPNYNLPALVKALRDRVRELEKVLGLSRVVLFGSWAKARETAFSDIDLLVIYTGPHREDAYAMAKKYIHLEGLEPHVYSEQEAARLKETIDRMTREGIVIFPARFAACIGSVT